MSQETVLLNDFRRQWRATGDEVLAAVARVGESGWYILGEEVRGFEAALAAAWPAPHAVGVGSGLDAIEIALRCADVKPGDRVLTTPLSAFATTLAIVRAGAVPVFADVDASGLLDLEACASVLESRHDIRAVLPVHLYGHVLDLDQLAAVAQRFGVAVIEDCAQCIGARWRGRPAGSVGAVATTSFYPTKNLGALGDGGAVITGDAALATQARELRHYGQSATYIHDRLGLNSRLDELHAAILARVFLPHLHDWTGRRREVAAAYRDGIANPRIVLPPVPAGSESVWHLFPVIVAGNMRGAFMAHLKAAGVQAGVHYPKLIPEQRALATAPFFVDGDLAQARRFADGEVSLPIHPFLTNVEVERVIAACNAWRPA